jgi:ferrochelatase
MNSEQKKSCFGCRPFPDRVGVLLAQLGTPDAPTAKCLRPYLRQFLSDRRVIEINRILWKLLLEGIILRTRPRRSAALYQRIWTAEGSPLLSITKRQTEGLRARLQSAGRELTVVFGMRYGKPSLESALDQLIEQGCSRILLFPMYPQYAAPTTASTYDSVFVHLLKRRWVPTLRVVSPYYRHPAYIKALAAGINQELASDNYDQLLLSYHGVPRAYVEKGDPYCCMCTETSAALRPLISLPPEKIVHTYQSQFGKDPWLTPYTADVLNSLPQQGVKRLLVASPGFTADCLETLDELGNEGSEAFEEHGGEHFKLVPCLNDSESWLDAMFEIVSSELGSWGLEPEQANSSCAAGCASRVRCSVPIDWSTHSSRSKYCP